MELFLMQLFNGISVSSILLLAALGLAITFGLMGVINMAHGEFIMIGAYTAYVVQNIFQAYFPSQVFDVYCIVAIILSFLAAASLGYVLERLRFPSKLVFLFLFTYRYLHVIADEWHKLHGAARLRGFAPKTNMHTYRTFGNMLGMVFVHSFDRSVRVYEAMILRGFSGRFQSVTAFRATSRDAVFAVAAFACMVCLVAFDLYLEFPRG